MLRRRIILIVRIAWSVFFGIVCVLCLVLWPRSYTKFDWFGTGVTFSPAPGKSIGGHKHFEASSGYVFESANGGLFLLYVGNMGDRDSWGWHFRTNEVRPFFIDSSFKPAERFRFRLLENGTWQAKAPLWYLAVVSGLLSTLAWFKRFSMRTMLVSTSIVAVLLTVALRL